jgi:hypothetical protein
MSTLTSSAVVPTCAHCSRPVINNGVYYGGMVFHRECTESPYKPKHTHKKPDLYFPYSPQEGKG